MTDAAGDPTDPSSSSPSGWRSKLRVEFRAVMAHILASYAAAPLFRMLLAQDPDIRLGVWANYLLAPVFVAVLVGIDVWYFLVWATVYLMGHYEGRWHNPALVLATYCGAFAVCLFVVRWVDHRIRARRIRRAGPAGAGRACLSAVKEVASSTVAAVLVLAIIVALAFFLTAPFV